MNCNRNVEIQDIADVPIDNLESIPDYFITERDLLDESTGNTIRSFTRTPGAKVMPNGNFDNIVALTANNVAIVVPEGQVVPCYIQNAGSMNIMQKADGDHDAVFLAVGELADQILVQNCGFVNIPNGHQYIVGQKYYLSTTAGEVTTNPSLTGQYLFTPISDTKLAVRI